MIYKDFIKCYSYDDYVENKEEILPETIVFNAEEGNEKLITQNYEFDFIPSGGEVGQVLTKSEEGYEWQDLQSGEFSEEAIVNFFDDVKFDEDANEFIFSNKGKEVKRLDASPFIVDNFVKEVDVVGTDLVITFNTEDKSAIRVPLSKIFDSNNYYTKEEINDKHYVSAEQDYKMKVMSKEDYDSLDTKDENTLYFITD